MKQLFLSVCLMTLPLCVFAGDGPLARVMQGDHRAEANKARDTYRMPKETLAFFGLKSDMTVVEVWPGGGWYTEILAPYLKEKGALIVTSYDQNPDTQKGWMARVNKSFEDSFMGKTDLYGNIQVVNLALPTVNQIAEPGSVDLILDFRNAHNWIRWGAEDMLKAWHAALKVGGIVGVVDHRMDDDKTYDPGNGYIHEKQLIDLMTRHGFELVDRSDHLRNAKDTKDHTRGVWSLPPTLVGGEKDRDKYLSIGESDRLALKFRKK